MFNEYAVTTNFEFMDKSTTNLYILKKQTSCVKKKIISAGAGLPTRKKKSVPQFTKNNVQLLLVGSA